MRLLYEYNGGFLDLNDVIRVEVIRIIKAPNADTWALQIFLRSWPYNCPIRFEYSSQGPAYEQMNYIKFLMTESKGNQ